MILNKYFSWQIWASFIGFGLVLGGLAWMVQILLLLKFIIKYGIDISSFIGMSIYTVPFLAEIIAPFILFVAVMFVYNKSIANSEIVICFASGQTPFSVAKPAILVGIIVMVLHLAGNLFVVPKSQQMLFNSQWEMRYGLGHLKLREANFNYMAKDVVIYAEQANQKDIFGVIIRDGRDQNNEKIVTAENGKLVNMQNGLSVVMGKGGLQISGDNGSMVGTFDGAQMEIVSNKNSISSSLRARRLSTSDLIKMLYNLKGYDKKETAKITSEAATRFLSPIMDLILVLIAMVALLKMTLLRRRISFSAAAATIAMALAEILFISISSLITTLDGLIYFGIGQVIIIIGLLWLLKK